MLRDSTAELTSFARPRARREAIAPGERPREPYAMDQDRWRELSRLFHEASAAPPDEREALLRRASERAPALADEQRALIEAADAPGDLHRRVHRAAETLEADPRGRTIGPYRVVREEGRGGMGRVFLCERADGHFDQIVAVKVMHLGAMSEGLQERFRQERQILARLQHPHIARLLDGGLTDEGEPYFALEYVDGRPIDEYCDEQSLAVEDRLRLFQDVCRALVYAHANLVIHRDLKPDNILVTAEGRVKLLDFGIAKVLVEDDGAPAPAGTALWALTPSYASPEQVRGEPVGTATDVYSLGVILYELLTGVRPYVVGGSPTAIEHVVCSTEPDRPSTRIAKDTTLSPEEARAVGRARSTDPVRLRKRLTGDLDVICMKALRKEPENRYASVDALLDDITRHLEGRTVQARPATLSYRLGKAVRRNRWAVGAAAAVLVSSSALVAFYTARLADERDAARTEAAKAREVADFLQGLFEVSDPDESRGQTVTARELLEAGAREVETGLEGQPEVQATMLRVIGEVYSALGLARDAEPLLQQAYDVNVRLYGQQHEETAFSQLSLASVKQDLGEIEAAGPHFRQAVETLELVLPPQDPLVSEAVEQLAFWLETNGDYEGAEAEYRAALAALRSAGHEDDPAVASLLSSLGNLLRNSGEREAAETILREALALQTELYGERHTDVASTMRQLASLLRDEDRFVEADTLYQRVLAIRRELMGPVHPEIAVALNSYAIMLSRMGESDRALATYEEFAAMLDQIHDGPHPDVAAAQHNLAMELTSAGRIDEALDGFRRSLEIQEEVYRPGHPNRAFPLVGMASALRAADRLDEAEDALRRALAIRREALPVGHRHIGEALSDLGAVLMDQGRHPEAEPFLVEAYDMLLEGEGPEAGRTRTAKERLDRLRQERSADSTDSMR